MWTAALRPAAKTGKQDAQKIHDYIVAQCKERIMVIDGAMGTTVQQYKFSEEDFPFRAGDQLNRARASKRRAAAPMLNPRASQNPTFLNILEGNNVWKSAMHE